MKKTETKKFEKQVLQEGYTNRMYDYTSDVNILWKQKSLSKDLTKWTRNEQNKKTIDKFGTSIVLYTIFITFRGSEKYAGFAGVWLSEEMSPVWMGTGVSVNSRQGIDVSGLSSRKGNLFKEKQARRQ